MGTKNGTDGKRAAILTGIGEDAVRSTAHHLATSVDDLATVDKWSAELDIAARDLRRATAIRDTEARHESADRGKIDSNLDLIDVIREATAAG